jgi:hypothetical protein
VEIGPPQAPPMTQQPGQQVGTAAQEAGVDDTPGPDGEPSEPASGPQDDATEAQKAELAAFRRFVAKRGKLGRPFAFDALAKADAVQAEQLNLLAQQSPEEARDHAARLLAELTKAADAGGRGHGGPAPPSPRRGHGTEYATYPLHAPRARPECHSPG